MTPIEAVFVPHWDGGIFLWWVDLLDLASYLSCLISRGNLQKKVDEITLTLYRITTIDNHSGHALMHKFQLCKGSLRFSVGNGNCGSAV